MSSHKDKWINKKEQLSHLCISKCEFKIHETKLTGMIALSIPFSVTHDYKKKINKHIYGTGETAQ